VFNGVLSMVVKVFDGGQCFFAETTDVATMHDTDSSETTAGIAVDKHGSNMRHTPLMPKP
jgi:hypothetical protein